MTLSELIENFEFLDDWEERYKYVLDLGKNMPKLPQQFHTEEYKVKGCVSQVWLICNFDENTQKYHFIGDSDAHLVQGLIAILMVAFSDKTAHDILNLQAQDIFQKLNLQDHITPQRSNGLVSMVQRIHDYAAQKRPADNIIVQ